MFCPSKLHCITSDPLNQFKRILSVQNVFVATFLSHDINDHLYKTKPKIFEYCQLTFDILLTFKMCIGLIFITFSIHYIFAFILLTPRKATKTLIHSANNYFDLLPVMSKYCCPVEI